MKGTVPVAMSKLLMDTASRVLSLALMQQHRWWQWWYISVLGGGGWGAWGEGVCTKISSSSGGGGGGGRGEGEGICMRQFKLIFIKSKSHIGMYK